MGGKALTPVAGVVGRGKHEAMQTFRSKAPILCRRKAEREE